MVNPPDIPKNGPLSPESQNQNEKDAADSAALEASRAEISSKLPNSPLQVENMEASDELQRRRRQMKKSLMDASTGPVIEGEVLSDEDEFLEKGGGLLDILKAARFSPRTLRFCLGAFFLILLGGALIWGGVKGVSWILNWFDQEPTQEEPEQPTNPDAPGLPSHWNLGGIWKVEGDLDDSIFAGILNGLETAHEDTAILIGQALGAKSSSDEFTQILIDFSHLNEALTVDVNELLAKSNDRQQALDGYVSELYYLQDISEANVETLTIQNTQLSDQFTVFSDKKDTFEELFFTKLADADPFGSQAALDEFVSNSQDLVAIRAQFLANEKLLEYYEQLLDILNIRLTAIELNEEALIKGIQVVDIPGANLNLILEAPEF